MCEKEEDVHNPIIIVYHQTSITKGRFLRTHKPYSETIIRHYKTLQFILLFKVLKTALTIKDM